MDKQLRDFFGAAKTLSLSAEERSLIKEKLVRAAAANRHLEPMAALQSASGVALSDREKGEVFDQLYRHMQRHPVAKTAPRPSWSFFFNMQRLVAVATCVVLLIGMGGTAAYADDAMPDETLYPVKVYFNEPVRELVTFGQHRQAQWRLEKVRRRMKEMRHLAGKEQLPVDIAERFSQRLTQSITRFEQKISELEENNASTELIDQYEQVLSTHQEALQRLEAGEAPPAIHQSIMQVRQAHREVFGDRRPPPHQKARLFRQHLKQHGPRSFQQLRTGQSK